MIKAWKYCRRFLLLVFTIILIATIDLVAIIYMFCQGPSKSARDLFVTTMLETGQLKFVVSIFMDEDEIMEAVNSNKLVEMDSQVDTGLITVNHDSYGAIYGEVEENTEPIVIEEVAGRTFFAKMMIIQDPSRVKVGTTYPWGEFGMELGKIVDKYGATAGVNGGLYVSTGNTGGTPCGLVVSHGQIQYNNSSSINGLYIIGFNEDDILVIKNIKGMSNGQVEKIVKEERIRDAICFQEESSDANNHFVPLIINGEPRTADGLGSGANPRTAIGQRQDGAVLILVTDGRGTSGHLGATATDLIQIMQEFGAVNAANIDGGSSSSMYYDGHYEMTSVTFYYANSSWKLPTAFIVE